MVFLNGFLTAFASKPSISQVRTLFTLIMCHVFTSVSIFLVAHFLGWCSLLTPQRVDIMPIPACCYLTLLPTQDTYCFRFVFVSIHFYIDFPFRCNIPHSQPVAKGFVLPLTFILCQHKENLQDPLQCLLQILFTTWSPHAHSLYQYIKHVSCKP